jgi:D-alanine-D-alanine ligase
MMDRGAKFSIINSALKRFDTHAPKIAILLIVNMQTETVENDYKDFSVVTSYYTDRDLEDLLSGFKEFAEYVDVSYGEEDFINKLNTGYFNQFKNIEKIVYTQTATGVGRSKSALTPALCELYKIKYCSNDIFTGALLDNKMAANKLLKAWEVHLPDTWFYYYKLGWIGPEPTSNQLLICKSAYECASIGVTKNSVSAINPDFRSFIHDLSYALRQPVIVQSFIEGYEVEVPVIKIKDPMILGMTGISLNGNKELGKEILTYDTIFEHGFDLFNFGKYNSDISNQLENETLRIYNTLQLKGPVRMDYRVTEAGEFFLMDYNNSPHLGMQHSFAFAIAEYGLNYSDLLKLLVYSEIFQN